MSKHDLMHEEIIQRVSARTGVTPWVVDAVASSIFTGIQHATQHPEYAASGIDLGPLMKLEVNYYYTVTMMHRLLLDHDIWTNAHPADNYTVVDKWQMIQNWEKYRHVKYKNWRLKMKEDLNVDYSNITPEYDKYLLDKRQAHCKQLRKWIYETYNKKQK